MKKQAKGMSKDDLLLELVPLLPEHSSEMEGCTHTCRHIPAILDEGRSIRIYPVRLVNAEEKAISAALCRECFVRLPRENQICNN
jgi:hypothetical protein